MRASRMRGPLACPAVMALRAMAGKSRDPGFAWASPNLTCQQVVHTVLAVQGEAFNRIARLGRCKEWHWMAMLCTAASCPNEPSIRVALCVRTGGRVV
jgi:hypothetical protein